VTADASMTPSTAWSERLQDGEAQRYERQAERIAKVQNAMTAKYGRGRTLHRKPILGLSATVEVLPGLPEHAAHGLFARPATYEALVRLSNGGFHVAPDRVPDIRGFAIKVLGVEGPGALGGTTTAQDVLLINHPAFALPTSEDFVRLTEAAARGQLATVRFAFVRGGLFGGAAMLKRLRGTLGRPFAGFAAETFWTAAPVANGPYAMRLRVVPLEPRPAPDRNHWGGDITERLAEGPLSYSLDAQFFVDEATTPIEDPTVDWPSPYLTVARITIPQQDPGSPEGRSVADRVERTTFDPWTALAEHRPLGEIMRARKVAYRVSQVGRGAAS
jgi:hypothetical protein